MIVETSINLKNKSKEDLILLLNESLDVIEKLQKENEELKDFRKRFVDTNNKELQEANEYFMFRYTFRGDELAKHINALLKVANNSIPTQKIKDKIKILEKLQNEFLNNEELRIKIIAYKELIKERSDRNENM